MRRLALLFGILGLGVLAASPAIADGYLDFVSTDACGCEEPVYAASYYIPAAPITYGDSAVVRWRYRPILGGTITRMRYVNYGYAPAYYGPLWW